MMISIHEWIQYLNPKVNKDLYVFGAQGQNIVPLMNNMCQMAGSLDKVNKILTLWQKRLRAGYTLDEIDAFDCSGLFMKFAIEHGLFKHDMTADGIYKSIPDIVALQKVQVGDFVFYGSMKKNEAGRKEWHADHIGYVVDSTHVIEARGSAYGVVKTLISDRPWERAKRPYWWSDIQPEPTPTPTPTLSRELKYTQPTMMSGNDVKEVQEKLNSLSYNCGKADGILGKNTEIAVKNFQKDNNLIADGIVGERTALKLGFIWKG